MPRKKTTNETGVTYQCKECIMNTNYENSLKRHMDEVHGEKINCNRCNNKFSQRTFSTHVCIRQYRAQCDVQTQTSPSREPKSCKDTEMQTIEPDIMNIICSMNETNEPYPMPELDLHSIIEFVNMC